MSDRFHEDVVEDFLAEYAEGRTPNPCLRCNERISSPRCSTGPSPWDSTPSSPGTTPGCAGPDGLIEMHRAEDMAKDQSYVLGVLTQEQLAHSMFPLGDTPKARIREEAARRGIARRRQAGQPRHLLHQRR